MQAITTSNEDDDWAMPESKPHWACQSCGRKDLKRPLPRDRAAYYASPKPARCGACGSHDLTPQGF